MVSGSHHSGAVLGCDGLYWKTSSVSFSSVDGTLAWETPIPAHAAQLGRIKTPKIKRTLISIQPGVQRGR